MHLTGLWSYRVMKAPSPDDINFQTLWTPFYARQWRCFWTLFPLVLAILFPIGLLTGAITNIHQALCSGTPQTNPLYVSSICDAVNNFWTRLLKDIVTGLLPTIINTFFDTYVMPLVFFFITQAERSYVSFSSQDRKVAYYFLIYDIINSFLMVVFSSGIIAQIGNVVNKAQNHTTTHTSYISNIANALNGSCNFFFVSHSTGPCSSLSLITLPPHRTISSGSRSSPTSSVLFGLTMALSSSSSCEPWAFSAPNALVTEP